MKIVNNIMELKTVEFDTQKPAMLLWTDSSMSNGHAQVTALAAKALEEKGFQPVILTTEDTLARIQNAHLDFGNAVLVSMPSQKTFARITGYNGPDPSGHGRFIHINHPDIRKEWDDIFDSVLETVPNIAGFSMEHYPGGRSWYKGVLNEFIEKMRSHNPDAVIDTILHSVPWIDKYSTTDSIGKALRKFDIITVIGPEDFPLSKYIPSASNEDIKTKLHYVGYFASDVPEKSENAGKEILITSGGAYTGKSFFINALRGIARSELKNTPICINIGAGNYHLSDELLIDTTKTDYVKRSKERLEYDIRDVEKDIEDIRKTAQSLKLKVSGIYQGMPAQEYKQRMVDSKILITVSGTNNLLEGIRAGVPVIGSNLAAQANTVAMFDEGTERLKYMDKKGQAVMALYQTTLDPEEYGRAIDKAYGTNDKNKTNAYDWNGGPGKYAELIREAYDQKQSHAKPASAPAAKKWRESISGKNHSYAGKDI